VLFDDMSSCGAWCRMHRNVPCHKIAGSGNYELLWGLFLMSYIMKPHFLKYIVKLWSCDNMVDIATGYRLDGLFEFEFR
jgi:hypothetical protein